MKEINGEIQHNGETYKLVFNLNVMEIIQDKYGSIDKWAELTDGTGKEPNIEAVIFGITEMINEGIDIDNENATAPEQVRRFLTKKRVGRILTDIGVQEVTQVMNDTVVASTKGEEKNE